jgi:hypothetical protein
VARGAAARPHFAHSFEWLLFSALDRHVGPAAPPAVGLVQVEFSLRIA